MNRLLLLLAAVLASGLIAAGCGDDDDDNGDDSAVATESAPVETTSTDSTEPTEPTESTDTSSGDVDSGGQAVESCKRGVEATAGQLSEGLRSELEDLCDKAASGDEEDVREASVEICKRIVKEALPAESTARDEGLQVCEGSQP